MITPNLQVVSGHEAIIGGVRADWEEPDNAPMDIWENGQFALRDFCNLTKYLARSTTREQDSDGALQELLKGAFGEPQTEVGGKEYD